MKWIIRIYVADSYCRYLDISSCNPLKHAIET